MKNIIYYQEKDTILYTRLCWQFGKIKRTSLPPKNEFCSELNNKNVSESDYKHAKEVWDAFNIKSVRHYHDLYIQSNVILLADVFETFRDAHICLTYYELDPAWYYTAPGLSRDAMLKR